jgi:hypothetical protein
MSRSIRKPYWTEGYGGKWRSFSKRQASKKVRQTKFIGNNAYYKRIYESWDICDFKFLEPIESHRLWKVGSK